MNASTKEQLMKKILARISSDAIDTKTASTEELNKATTQLIKDAENINEAFFDHQKIKSEKS